MKKQMDNFNQHFDFLLLLTFYGLDPYHPLDGGNSIIDCGYEYLYGKFPDPFSFLLLQLCFHVLSCPSWERIDICKLFHDVSLQSHSYGSHILVSSWLHDYHYDLDRFRNHACRYFDEDISLVHPHGEILNRAETN